MRTRFGVTLLLLTAAVAYWGCRGTGTTTGPTGGVYRNAGETGPCEGVDPVGFADDVVTDARTDAECDTFELGDAQAMLGAPDGLFAALGGDEGSYVILRLETEVFDGDGNDLVVYEVADGEGADYDVFLSDNPDSGFVLIAEVGEGGTYCIELRDTGIDRGQYVKLVQAANVPVPFDTTVTYDTTVTDTSTVIDTVVTVTPRCEDYRGADIDAVGVISNCPDPAIACEVVGREVDRLVPPDGDYRNHGAYVSSVAHAATDVIREFKMTDCLSSGDAEGVHGCVVSERAKTNIGKR